MELPLVDQLKSYLDKSEKILIALPNPVYADTLAAGLAWKSYLEQIGKHVVVAGSGMVAPSLSFLEGADSFVSTLEVGHNFIVEVSTKDRKLGELSYHTENNSVKIFLKAKEGSFTPADITLKTEGPNFDLIFVIGAPNLEALGVLFTTYADTFYDIPKINIDISSANEYFGAINMVEVRAVALCELVTELFTNLGFTQIDEKVATLLLAGIMANTQSFQSVKTTPKTMSTAAELLLAGARQQDIVQHLFKTKPLSLLKLWGRALARLKIIQEYNYMYSVISTVDLEKTESMETDLPLVLAEFIENVAGFKTIGLVVEKPSKESEIFLTVDPQLDLESFATTLGAGPMRSKVLPGGRLYVSAVLSEIDANGAEAKLITALERSLPKFA